MPRFKTVSTIEGTNTFQLQPQDFVEVYENNELLYRATRTEIRKAVKALDKFLAKNPNPTVSVDSVWGLFPSVAEVNVGYGTTRRAIESYNVRYNDEGGINIGCMRFDKKSLNKLRTWAATTAKKTTKKKASKKTLKAAA